MREQACIGTFLANLDRLITLHQRGANSWGRVRLPRFCSTTIFWEQRKLGEIVDRVVRKNSNNESSLPLTISAQYGLVDQITYFNNRVASRDVSNYYLVLNGEFAYNKSSSDGFPFGTIKRLDLYDKGVLSTLYIVFSVKDAKQLNSDFLTVYFDTNRWHKGVSERAAEGARNHGLLNISAEDFLDIDVTIPSEEKEQAAIGALFEDINRLITLHQCKPRLLSKLRKMQILPKNALLRRSLTTAWEQRKLGELCQKTTGGGTPSTGVAEYWNGEIPWFQSSDFKEGIVSINSSNKHISQAGLQKSAAQLIPEQSIAIVTRVGFGKLALIPFQYTTSQDVLSLSYLTVDPVYAVYSVYKKIQSELMAVQGTSIKGVTKDDLLTKDLNLSANREEQEKIGALFSNVDRLITLHQRESELVRNRVKTAFWRTSLNYYDGWLLRFTSAWEQRKLGELGKAISGVGFPDSEQGGSCGVPFYKVSDMNAQGNEHEMTIANNYVTEEQIARRKWKPVSDVPAMFFAKVGAAVMLNRKRLVRSAFLLDNNTMAYSLKQDSWDTLFAKSLFETLDLTALVQVGALPSYNASDVEDVEIKLPSLREQACIGTFLANLDRLITLHQREFTHTNPNTNYVKYYQRNRPLLCVLRSMDKSV